MPVRLTERRLPDGYAAADFGESAGDTSAALISYHSSPIVVGRLQTYVALVLDAAMQPNVASFRWQVAGETTVTPDGVFSFTPAAEEDVEITVDILDSGDVALKSITLAQQVNPLHPELETLLEKQDEVSAIAADPETSRELVNDVRAYIDELAPRSADPVSSLNRLVFAIAYAEALRVPPDDRAIQTERLAAALGEGAVQSFIDQADVGIGLCQIRPHILAMYIGTTATGTDRLITPRELPADKAARRPVHNELKAAFTELDAAIQADVFNLLRFPKSNLRMAVRLVEAMREQYFAAGALPVILDDGDTGKALIEEFKDGPFVMV